MSEKQLTIIKRVQLKKNKIQKGFTYLLGSLLPIIIGPVIIQIGDKKYDSGLNIYTFLGVFFCVIGIFLIFKGIFKIINTLFEK